MSRETVRNAAERLRNLLRAARYPQLSALRLENGDVSDLLRVLHYVLLDSSLLVAQFLVDRGYDLYGKTDVRFVESAFRLLRDEFLCFPALSVNQFLSRQFVARRISIVAEAAAAVAKKHHELQMQKRSEEAVWSLAQTQDRMRNIKPRVENHALPASISNHAASILQHLKLQPQNFPKTQIPPVQIQQIEQVPPAPIISGLQVAVQSASDKITEEVHDSRKASTTCSCAENTDTVITAIADLARLVSEITGALTNKLSNVEDRLGRIEDQLHGIQAAVTEQQSLVQKLDLHPNRGGDDTASPCDDKLPGVVGSIPTRRLHVESPCTWPPQPSVFERF